MTKRCNIVTTTRVSNQSKMGGIPWEALPQETVSYCSTHSMEMTGRVIDDRALCPIGRIEEATEKALAAIEEAKR